MNTHIAILDDEARMAEVLAMVLRKSGYEVSCFYEPQRLLAALESEAFDLLLSDLKMPGMDGVEVLSHVKRIAPDMPVILLTAHGTVETAVMAMKRGAFDYLQKPIDNDACRVVVARALEMQRLTRENEHLRAQIAERHGSDAIIAESPAMRAALDLALRAAKSNASVLISGESGTGKEVVARAIHVHSARVAGPFVAVNCKAFASGVLESELFGHERGAFTGASQARAGVFERAGGGTLLLDEIGEVGADFQAKLLRVLQEREVQRVGGDRPLKIDVRIVAATNRDLPSEVAAGAFREDLYFRMAVVPITLPPLRERREDILPLARAFLDRLAREQRRDVVGWTEEVEARLLGHDWPGNVRELENTLERGVVLARGDRIEIGDLMLDRPARVRASAEDHGAEDASREDASREDNSELPLQAHLDRAAAQRIRDALAHAGGVRIEAARALGVERTTLYRLMKRFDIDE